MERCEPDQGHYDYDETDADCFQCGGEGFVYGCRWDWQCDTWDGDSCLCQRHCDVCNPPRLTPEQQTEKEKLLQLLANMLTPKQDEPHADT